MHQMRHRVDYKLSCRQIGDDEVGEASDLLQAGFPARSRRHWDDGLARLGAHAPPDGFPRLGYALRSDETLVGALLLIASRPAGKQTALVNVSSWFVRPEYRAYAPLLVLRATGRKAATYLNISPAAHTRAIIEAQGFSKVREGMFVGVPALARPGQRARLSTSPREWEAAGTIDEQNFQLLMDHHRFGCIAIWCETEEGAQAFIFREQRLRFRGMRCAQLLYAPSAESLERRAGVLGKVLARRGLWLMLTGAAEPLRGVPGRHFPRKRPVYVKGPEPPSPFDLTYTEAAVLGL